MLDREVRNNSLKRLRQIPLADSQMNRRSEVRVFEHFNSMQAPVAKTLGNALS
jgi:hypothetical protein